MERDYKTEIKEELEARKLDLKKVQEELGQNRNIQQQLRNQEIQLLKTLDTLNGAMYILSKLLSPKKEEEANGEGTTEKSEAKSAENSN